MDWTAAWSAIRRAPPALLVAAFVANAISLVLRGVRWWLFLRPAGARSLWLAMRAAIAGAALNNVVLAQGGEAARVVFVSRASGVSSATVLATLALERMFDAVGFVVLLVVATLVFPLPSAMQQWRIPAGVILAAMIIALLWFTRAARGVHPERLLEPPPRAATFRQRLRDYVRWFGTSARALASGPRFAAALALSLVAWWGHVLTYQWCADATGVEVPLGASLAALLAVNVGFLVRATPGNVGVFQVIYAVTVAQFGVARDPAIAASLLIQTLQIIPLTLVGVALAPAFVFRRRRMREEGAS